jgi:2-oxoacid:acceptor oxidoreductase delta subunit (pyruvate/2-ketoisovalerate family)
MENFKECKKPVDLESRAAREKGGRGFRQVEATEEAQRCLGLRECDSCDVCSLLCPDLCITRDEGTGEVLIDLDYCKGCGICAAVCPKGAIRMILET